MSVAKRVYFYLVYFITLGMFAAGAGILLGICLDVLVKYPGVGIGAEAFAREMLSLGLAMLVIGGGLWFVFWRAIQRNVTGKSAEIGSAVRKLFMNLVMAVTVLIALYAAVDFLRWLMAGVPLSDFPSGALARLIVTGIIWYYHWRITEKEGQPSPAAQTLRRWYVYLLSGWGLVALSANLVGFINTTALQLPIWGETVISGDFWNASVQSNLCWILLGGSIWAFHWFGMTRGDSGSILRRLYVYLLAIAGGTVAGVVALTISLYRAFRFAFGSLATPAGTYFQFLGWTVPTIVVAVAIWVYHQRLIREEASQAEEQLSVRQVPAYIMSFIGLGTLAVGLAILVGIPLELPLRSVSIATTVGWWSSPLSLCLALLVVGLPIWLYYWGRVLQMTDKAVVERRARSRRIFLFGVLGVTVVMLAADLVNIVYQLINGVLQGSFGVEVLRDSKWSLQGLVVAAPMLLYHWQVLRQDQRLGVERAAAKKTVTFLIGDEAITLVSQIEKKLGYKVHMLRYLGRKSEGISVLSEEGVGKLADEIRAVPGTRVMLIVSGGKILVLPYQEK